MFSNQITAQRSIRLPASVFLAVLTLLASGCTDSNDPMPAPETLQIEAVSATRLDGTVGEAVNPVPSVIVKTPEGKPVPGITVGFRLLNGESEESGSVSNSMSASDRQGMATAETWTLGTTATFQELTATLLAEGPTRSVKFTVNATAAAPARIDAGVRDTLAGLPEWTINGPTVLMFDRFGNRVERSTLVVKFGVVAGDGHLANTEVKPDTFGIASAGGWTLGTNPGLNSVIASVDGLGEVTFTARALDARDLVWYDLDSIKYVEGTDTTIIDFDHGSIGFSSDGHFVGETYYQTGRRWNGGRFLVSGTEMDFNTSSGDDDHFLSGGQLTENGLLTFWCFGPCYGYEKRTYTRRIEDETPSAARNRQR